MYTHSSQLMTLLFLRELQRDAMQFFIYRLEAKQKSMPQSKVSALCCRRKESVRLKQ
jgi:hypothetical protein